MNNPAHLQLSISPSGINLLSTFFQRGFFMHAKKSLPMLQFLSTMPGFSASYVTNNIETIFINGVAVDDVQATISPGDILALSAAMPGLAGAIFRRSGPHASLRSHPKKQEAHGPAEYVTIKLFNSVARDKGPQLLEQGILCSGSSFSAFYTSSLVDLNRVVLAISLDDALVAETDLAARIQGLSHLLLVAKTG